MKELIKLVSEKTGLPEETAKMAVEIILGYLKSKLPAPVAGQIDNIFDSSETAGQAGGLMKGLTGLFGRK